jgi:hypothetical protein
MITVITQKAGLVGLANEDKMDQILFLISLFNVLVLIAIITVGIRWQKRHGMVTEKKFALIFLGYFSYSFISLMIPAFLINPGVGAITIIGFLLVLWGLGYPFIRWLYRQFNPPK